eukprot:403369475
MPQKKKERQPIQLIIQLFDLPKNNTLLDDIGCVLRSRMSQCTGRLYIFEKYFCFYSKMLGQETKVIMPIKKIKNLKKAKSLGLLQNAIKFYMEDEKKYFFKRIKNRDQRFDMIYQLWLTESHHARHLNIQQVDRENFRTEIGMGSGCSDQEDLMATLDRKSNKQVFLGDNLRQNQNRFSNRRSLSIDQSMFHQIVKGQINIFNTQIEDQTQATNLGADDEPLNIRYTNYFGSTLSSQQNNTQLPDQQPVIIVKEAQENEILSNLNQIQIDNQQKQATRRQFTDSELLKEIEQYQMPKGHCLLNQSIYDISVNDFYEFFLKLNSSHSLRNYFTQRGEKKITCTDWQLISDSDKTEIFGLIPQSLMILGVEMQMKDNAFVKVSPTTKNYFLLQKTENLINLRIFNQMKDIPYADTFNTEENWIITSPSIANDDSIVNDRCVIRSTFQVIFKKSTMFKGRIETNSTKGTLKNFDHYCNWVKENIQNVIQEKAERQSQEVKNESKSEKDRQMQDSGESTQKDANIQEFLEVTQKEEKQLTLGNNTQGQQDQLFEKQVNEQLNLMNQQNTQIKDQLNFLRQILVVLVCFFITIIMLMQIQIYNLQTQSSKDPTLL